MVEMQFMGGPLDGQMVVGDDLPEYVGDYIDSEGKNWNARYKRTDEVDKEGRRIFRFVRLDQEDPL